MHTPESYELEPVLGQVNQTHKFPQIGERNGSLTTMLIPSIQEGIMDDWKNNHPSMDDLIGSTDDFTGTESEREKTRAHIESCAFCRKRMKLVNLSLEAEIEDRRKDKN